MRNLFTLRDSLCTSATLPDDRIFVVAVDVNHSSGELLVLNEHGLLNVYDLESGSLLEGGWNLSNSAENGEDLTWFSLTLLRASGTIVCVSHTGLLISIPIDLSTSTWSKDVTVEGDVECGIINAAWSPDQSRLLLLTNQHTMLSMNSEWDVLDEVPLMESPLADTSVNISWRGDGEQFALQSVDTTGISTLRVYSNELELVSTGRNIADGPASVLNGVGNCVAFSTNGVLIAFPLQRIQGKHQIAFIEKNGLRHGQFDVCTPKTLEGYKAWSIVNLQWDLTSSLLAVEIRACREEGRPIDRLAPSMVQIYYRDNYHWYLKLQWTGFGLNLLRFDSEVRGRLYLSQPHPSSSSPPCVRVVELSWEVVRNTTRDASVAVADGNKLHLTPLGFNTIPPPMSMFQIPLVGPYKHACFWMPPSDYAFPFTSGLAVLSESVSLHGPLFNLELLYIDEKGKPLTNDGRVINMSELTYNTTPVRPRTLLAISMGSPRCLQLVVSCTYLGSSEDVTLLMEVDESASTIKIMGSIGSATSSHSHRLLQVIGMQGSFAILSNMHGNSEISIYKGVSDNVPTHIQALSEECCDAAVVHIMLPNTADKKGASLHENAISVELCFGLSLRGRLYCGEMLVEAGASSFAVNEKMGVLLYITTGTSPNLHFVSLLALAALDPDRDVDMDDGIYQMIQYAPPRPVERGARLVVSSSGAPRVVVQQPRGNLEAFEPRPLILSLARNLIDSESAQYVQCLLTLRRQRVDLNFMVDYNPARFIHYSANYIRSCLDHVDSNDKLVEVLCLFISSLEDGNASLLKYPLPLIQQVLQHTPTELDNTSCQSPDAVTIDGVKGYLESQNGEGKVNALCRLLRSHLEELLESGNPAALKPILCTFAKQKPPLIEDALRAIRKEVDASRATLTSSKAQGLLRYLAFLADGELIFNAALGICDFDMSRAIARQCQMDPKVYLPLLENFEAIGKRGSGPDSYEYWVMHVEVALHLKRPKLVIEKGLEALLAFKADKNEQESTAAQTSSPEVMSPETISKHILASTKETKLFSTVLEQLYAGKRAQGHPQGRSGDGLGHAVKFVNMLLSDVRYAYSAYLRLQKDPDCPQIIALLLLTEPPCASEAIEVALSSGYWQQALFLAGKYGHEKNVPRPDALANRIINTFESELAGSRDLVDSGELEETALTQSVMEGSTRSKALEISGLCLDHRNGDIEGAVSILLKSQEFIHAAHLAARKGRLDLLKDDVSRASRRAANEFIVNLNRYTERLLNLIADLKKMWQDPEKRLMEVREKDEKLSRELKWIEEGGNADDYDPDMTHDEDIDDTKSEFSMASMRSDLTFVSGASSILSELSQNSRGSQMSRASKSSAAVSVLSELKLEKKSSNDGDKNSTFSVKGLEHSLLSRGSGKDDPANAKGKGKNKNNFEKHLQENGQPLTTKQLRRKNRGEGISNRNRDTLGLGKELVACKELWKYIQVSALGRRCAELCQVLILLGSPEEILLAAKVQLSMDAYSDVVRNNPAPLSPAYPRKWLEKKSMTLLRRFQDEDATTAGNSAPSSSPSVWKVAADGISLWYSSLRLLSLNHVADSNDLAENIGLGELEDTGDY